MKWIINEVYFSYFFIQKKSKQKSKYFYNSIVSIAFEVKL